MNCASCSKPLRHSKKRQKECGNFCEKCNSRIGKIALIRQRIHHLKNQIDTTMSASKRRSLDWELQEAQIELDRLQK